MIYKLKHYSLVVIFLVTAIFLNCKANDIPYDTEERINREKDITIPLNDVKESSKNSLLNEDLLSKNRLYFRSSSKEIIPFFQEKNFNLLTKNVQHENKLNKTKNEMQSVNPKFNYYKTEDIVPHSGDEMFSNHNVTEEVNNSNQNKKEIKRYETNLDNSNSTSGNSVKPVIHETEPKYNLETSSKHPEKNQDNIFTNLNVNKIKIQNDKRIPNYYSVIKPSENETTILKQAYINKPAKSIEAKFSNSNQNIVIKQNDRRKPIYDTNQSLKNQKVLGMKPNANFYYQQNRNSTIIKQNEYFDTAKDEFLTNSNKNTINGQKQVNDSSNNSEKDYETPTMHLLQETNDHYSNPKIFKASDYFDNKQDKLFFNSNQNNVDNTLNVSGNYNFVNKNELTPIIYSGKFNWRPNITSSYGSVQNESLINLNHNTDKSQKDIKKISYNISDFYKAGQPDTALKLISKLTSLLGNERHDFNPDVYKKITTITDDLWKVIYDFTRFSLKNQNADIQLKPITGNVGVGTDVYLKPETHGQDLEKNFTNVKQNTISHQSQPRYPIYDSSNLLNKEQVTNNQYIKPVVGENISDFSITHPPSNKFVNDNDNKYFTNSNENLINEQSDKRKSAFHGANRSETDQDTFNTYLKPISNDQNSLQNPIPVTSLFSADRTDNFITNNNQNSINMQHFKENYSSNLPNKEQVTNNQYIKPVVGEKISDYSVTYPPSNKFVNDNDNKYFTNSYENLINNQNDKRKSAFDGSYRSEADQDTFNTDLKPIYYDQNSLQNPIPVTSLYSADRKDNSFTNTNQNAINMQHYKENYSSNLPNKEQVTNNQYIKPVGEKIPDYSITYPPSNKFVNDNDNKYFTNSNENLINEQNDKRKSAVYGSYQSEADQDNFNTYVKPISYDQNSSQNPIRTTSLYSADRKDNFFTNTNQNAINMQHYKENYSSNLPNKEQVTDNQYIKPVGEKISDYSVTYPPPNKFVNDNDNKYFTNSNENLINKQNDKRKSAFHGSYRSKADQDTFNTYLKPISYDQNSLHNPIPVTSIYSADTKDNFFTNTNQNVINMQHYTQKPIFDLENTAKCEECLPGLNSVNNKDSLYYNPTMTILYKFDSNEKDYFRNGNKNYLYKKIDKSKPIFDITNLFETDQYPSNFHLKPVNYKQTSILNSPQTSLKNFDKDLNNLYWNSNQNTWNKQTPIFESHNQFDSDQKASVMHLIPINNKRTPEFNMPVNLSNNLENVEKKSLSNSDQNTVLKEKNKFYSTYFDKNYQGSSSVNFKPISNDQNCIKNPPLYNPINDEGNAADAKVLSSNLKPVILTGKRNKNLILPKFMTYNQDFFYNGPKQNRFKIKKDTTITVPLRNLNKIIKRYLMPLNNYVETGYSDNDDDDDDDDIVLTARREV